MRRHFVLALVVIFVAGLLNVIAFTQPNWSKGHEVDASLTNEIANSDFKAGLWGFCTSIELLSNVTSTIDHLGLSNCFHFHGHSTDNFTDANNQVLDTQEFSGLSVCETYANAQSAGDLTLSAYIKMVAYIAGADKTKFGEFLEKSCSGTGNITRVFGGLSAGFNVFANILVVASFMCSRRSSSLTAIAIASTVLSFVAGVVAYTTWHKQTKMLEDTVNLRRGPASKMSLAASILNLIGAFYLMPENEIGTVNMLFLSCFTFANVHYIAVSCVFDSVWYVFECVCICFQ